jgi:hypothetical protein
MPGTGKSFVIDRICDLAKWLKTGYIATAAYNGIAAVNIDGVTLCSLLSINPQSKNKDNETLKPLTNTEKIQICEQLQTQNLCLLIIDEVSNLNGFCIAAIGSRLQEIMLDEREFGGVGILFFGDFGQLPPVKSESLAFTLMKFAQLQEQQQQCGPTESGAGEQSPFGDITHSNNSDGLHSCPSVPSLESIHSDQENAALPQAGTKCSDFTHCSGNLTRHNLKKRRCQPLMGADNTKHRIHSYGRYGIKSMKQKGAELFSQFQRYHLSKQQ